MKLFDEHTLYVVSGVAKKEQLYNALRKAIKQSEERLDNERLKEYLENKNDMFVESINPTLSLSNKNKIIREYLSRNYKKVPKKKTFECDIDVNVLIDRNGVYYGFCYVFVSNDEVYWMLLGRNPDGGERVLEYLDPEWIPPLPRSEKEPERVITDWYEMTLEEDKYIHPTIRESLEPLLIVPGYKYDKKQLTHLQTIAIQDNEDPLEVPNMGYFEISRAYSKDVPCDKMRNVLCARRVPNWITKDMLKEIFKRYATTGKVTADGDSYPLISLVEGKTDNNNIVFVTYDSESTDAIFALLMTRKIIKKHPKNPNIKAMLIFDHAFENNKRKKYNNKSGNNNNNYKNKNYTNKNKKR
jgi:hypothetical protein